MRRRHRPRGPVRGARRRHAHHHLRHHSHRRGRLTAALLQQARKSMQRLHVLPLDSGPRRFGIRKPPKRDWTEVELQEAWWDVGVPTLVFPEVPQDVISVQRVFNMKPELFDAPEPCPEEIPMHEMKEAVHDAVLLAGVLKWKHLRVASVRDKQLPTVRQKELKVPLTKEIIAATPTHYLAVYKPNDPLLSWDPLVRRCRRVDIYVIHSYVLALYCARLPHIPPPILKVTKSHNPSISRDTGDTISDALRLSTIHLCLPHPPSLPLMLMYFYTGDARLFSHQLLSAPGLDEVDVLDPEGVQDVGSVLAETLDPWALQLRTKTIHGLHANMVALRVDDRTMWGLLEYAWASIVWARYYQMEGIGPKITSPPPTPPVDIPSSRMLWREEKSRDTCEDECREIEEQGVEELIYRTTAGPPQEPPWRWEGYYHLD